MFLRVSLCLLSAALVIASSVIDVPGAPIVVPGAPIEPQADYEAFPQYPLTVNSTYKLHPLRASWLVAAQTCQDESAHLVIINSQEEANIVALMFLRVTPNPDYFMDGISIGIDDVTQDGTWFTIDGVLLSQSGYVNWGQNQPMSGYGHCGVASRAIQFHNAECNGMANYHVFPYVCERKVAAIVDYKNLI